MLKTMDELVPGDKVVCIDDDGSMLIYGNIYTFNRYF